MTFCQKGIINTTTIMLIVKRKSMKPRDIPGYQCLHSSLTNILTKSESKKENQYTSTLLINHITAGVLSMEKRVKSKISLV